MSRVGKSCRDSALASGPISNDAMLRHACGYALANRDTRALQAYLGHRNFRHTVPYTELAPTRAVPWNFALGWTKKFAVRATRSRPRRHASPRPSPAGGYVERAYLSKEASLMAGEADSVVRVCSKSEVAPGSVKAFAVGDKTLAVYNIDGTFYATDDECTHAAASLADGMIEGDVIECCMHMGSFHIPTGMVMQPPCEVPLRTYQVVLRDEDVFADLTHNAAGEAE